MEIAEQVYEGQTPYRKIPRADANRDSHVRNRKGGESALPTNPEKGRAVKRKTKNAVSPIKKMTSVDKTCFLHVPGHSSEEFKLLKRYSKKYSAQQPHKDSESRSGGKTKRNKTSASRKPISRNMMLVFPRIKRILN